MSNSEAEINDIDTINSYIEQGIDLYEVLLLTQDTFNLDKAKSNYRRLLNKYHPDKSKNKRKENEEKIQTVNFALKILRNPGTRAIYDTCVSNHDQDEDLDEQMRQYNPMVKIEYLGEEEVKRRMIERDQALIDEYKAEQGEYSNNLLTDEEAKAIVYDPHVEVSDKVKELRLKQQEISKIADENERNKQFNLLFKSHCTVNESSNDHQLMVYNGSRQLMNHSNCGSTKNYNTMFSSDNHYDDSFKVEYIEEEFDDRPLEEMMKEYEATTIKLKDQGNFSTLTNNRATYKFDFDD